MADNGSLIAQGISGGINDYIANRQKDAAVSGQIDAMIKQGGVNGIGMLSPDGQALFQKMANGKATLSDKLQLLGEAQTTIAMRKQQQDQALVQAQAQMYQAQAAQYGAAAARQNYFLGQIQNMPPAGSPSPQNVQQFGPPMAPGTSPLANPPAPQTGPGTVPAPGGAPQVKMAPPTPLTLNDPQGLQLYNTALSMTGDPDAATQRAQAGLDAMNKQANDKYTALANAKKPTGQVALKQTTWNKTGQPLNDEYFPLVTTGAGTIGESTGPDNSAIISVPHGATPPGKLVSLASLQPGPTPSASKDPDYNPAQDQDREADIKNGYANANLSANALAASNALYQAASAYTSGDMNRFNVIRGNPAFADVFSMLNKGGINPLAGLQQALYLNTQSILNQIRGPNGSVGGRILQTEYENTSKMLGTGQMDSPTIMRAARELQMLNDRRNNIDQAYARYRERMPDGEAYALAEKQFGQPPNLDGATPPRGSTNPNMVRVQLPNGSMADIPQANMAEAINRGAKPIW